MLVLYSVTLACWLLGCLIRIYLVDTVLWWVCMPVVCLFKAVSWLLLVGFSALRFVAECRRVWVFCLLSYGVL